MKLGFTMAALVLVGAVIASSGAQASSDPTWIACTTPNAAPAVAMPNCDAFLRSGAGTPMDRATAFYYRGNALFAQQNYSGAIGEYTSAVRLNPSYAKAFNNMGFAYSRLGDYAHAIPNYSVAINLDPQYALAWRNRGNAQANMGQYARAVTDYDRVIQLDPSDTVAYFNRGVAHYRSGAIGLAIADYDVVLSRTPNDQDAISNRALAQQQLAKFQAQQAEAERQQREAEDARTAQALGQLVGAIAAAGQRQAYTPPPQQQQRTYAPQQQQAPGGGASYTYLNGQCVGTGCPQTSGGGSGGRQTALNSATGQPCVTLVGQQRDEMGYYRLTLQNTCPRPFSTSAHIIPRNGTARTPVRGSGIVAAQGGATTSTITCSDHDSDPCAGFSDWWAN